MNTFKKMIITVGIIVTIIPQVCRALDAKGDTVANGIKLTYGTSISVSNLSNPNADFGKWNNFIINTVSPYVVENSSIAGIKDTLLMNSLKELGTYSSILASRLPTVRGGILLKGEKQIHEGILTRIIKDLENTLEGIDNTSTRLRQEKYYVTSKKNAQEILLLALDRTQQTTEKAIELLKTELQSRKG